MRIDIFKNINISVFICSIYFQYSYVFEDRISYGKVLVLLFIVLEMFRLFLSEDKKQIQNNGSNIRYFLLPLSCFLFSSLISTDPINSLSQYLNLSITFLAIYLAINLWISNDDYSKYLFVLISIILLSIIFIDSIIVLLNDSESIRAKVKGIRVVSRFFDDPNYMASIITFSLSISIFVLLQKPNKKTLIIFLLILSSVLVLMTISRSGLLSIIFVSVLTLYYFIKTASPVVKVIIFVLTFLVLGILTFSIAMYYEHIVEKNKQLERITLAVEGKDASVGQRYKILQVSFFMLTDNILYGVGYGQFENQYNKYRDKFILTGSNRASHNTAVRMLAENGLIVFLIIVGQFIVMYRLAGFSANVQSSILFMGLIFPVITLDFRFDTHFWMIYYSPLFLLKSHVPLNNNNTQL